ncbi:uncharacterized protein METZ01_LOCUS242449 [marine metagenome]|uniref:Uncharacterized protein n=1 Tax=marine metagenome TaxID=408172 RepID=A0A382HRB6_9ZZZZ
MLKNRNSFCKGNALTDELSNERYGCWVSYLKLNLMRVID